MYTYLHIHMHSCVYTYTGKHIHIHIHTHSHILYVSNFFPLGPISLLVKETSNHPAWGTDTGLPVFLEQSREELQVS